MNDRHDGVFGLQRLVLVALYGDDVVVGVAALGQVDLYSEVVADLLDHEPSLANDEGMVFWVHLEFQLKRSNKKLFNYYIYEKVENGAYMRLQNLQ